MVADAMRSACAQSSVASFGTGGDDGGGGFDGGAKEPRRSSGPNAPSRACGGGSPEFRRGGSVGSPDSRPMSRLREALEDKMGELRQVAAEAKEARRASRGEEIPLEGENDPATWTEAQLRAYLHGIGGASSTSFERADRKELVRRCLVAMGMRPGRLGRGASQSTAISRRRRCTL